MSNEITLNIHPTEKQHLAYQALETPILDPADGVPLTVEVFFGGGADGGKSWSICESRLMNAFKYPGYKSFIGRHELKRLMQSTYKTWIKVCAYHKIPRDEWRLAGDTHTIKFRNGSEIDLLDLKFLPSEDPLYERFGSLEYSDGAIEEAGEVHPLAHEVLKTRVSRWKNAELGINPSLLMTGNPKKNWTYHLFYKPWRDHKLAPEVHFIQALHKDNPYGERSYGKNLDRIKDEITRARLRDGNWEYEDDPSSLMNFNAIADLFTNTLAGFDEEEEGALDDEYLTVDVARYGDDKIVAMFWRGWLCYKILYKEKQGIDETRDWVAGLLSENHIPYSHCAIDEDGVGGGVVDGLRGTRGFLANATPIDKDEDDEVDPDDELDEEEVLSNKPEQRRAFRNLKAQCGYHAAEKVNNHRAAVRTKDQQIKEWLTEELEQVKEANVDGEGKRQLVEKAEVKIILGRSPDFGDAFIMRSVFDLKPPAKPKQTWSYRHTPQKRR